MPHLKNVLLLLDTSSFYGRKIAQGVAWYSDAHMPMAFYLQSAMGEEALQGLRNWKIDGVIGRLREGQLPPPVADGTIPAVSTTSHRPSPRLPRVSLDDEAIGDVVADHLIARGFRNFAFCGSYGMGFSVHREHGFRQRLQAGGFGCMSYQPGPGLQDAETFWESEQSDLGRWIGSLPRPVGVMAADDAMGWKIAQACRRTGIRMPEDVGLVGVNNDDMLCRLSSPPMSSVALPLEKLGYEAAAMLDALLHGRKPEPATVQLPPIGVIMRRSTDVIAVDDVDIVAAMRFIRDHVSEGIQVDDVAAAAAVSRRSLQRRFPQVVGRTLQEEIRYVRIAKARDLLAQTDLPLNQVASACGFRYPEHLSRIFRQETGVTPSDYRRRFRT